MLAVGAEGRAEVPLSLRIAGLTPSFPSRRERWARPRQRYRGARPRAGPALEAGFAPAVLGGEPVQAPGTLRLYWVLREKMKDTW